MIYPFHRYHVAIKRNKILIYMQQLGWYWSVLYWVKKKKASLNRSHSTRFFLHNVIVVVQSTQYSTGMYSHGRRSLEGYSLWSLRVRQSWVTNSSTFRHMIEWHSMVHTHCSNVTLLRLILCCNYVRSNHLGKWVKSTPDIYVLSLQLPVNL